MNYKIGKKLQWEDIEIGQVFYFEGCSGFGIKRNSEKFIIIDSITRSGEGWVTSVVINGKASEILTINTCRFYNIPRELKECLEVI